MSEKFFFFFQMLYTITCEVCAAFACIILLLQKFAPKGGAFCKKSLLCGYSMFVCSHVLFPALKSAVYEEVQQVATTKLKIKNQEINVTRYISFFVVVYGIYHILLCKHK